MTIAPEWAEDEDEGDLAYLPATVAQEIEGETAEELMKLSYPAYLRSMHWDHTRRRALLRAGHQCQRCEARDTRLDVHHLTYDRLGRESEADLIVLCSLCHAMEHRKLNVPAIREALADAGYSPVRVEKWLRTDLDDAVRFAAKWLKAKRAEPSP